MYCRKGHKIKQIIIALCLLAVPVLTSAENVVTDEARANDNSCRPTTSYRIPETLSFCGHPLPLQERHCREMLDRELTIAIYNQAQVIMWLKRAPRYFPLFTREIKTLGLPDDLKFLAVAESSLIEDIHSRAGAAGLWQFMRHTGRRLGLRITSTIDERLDPIAATRCALNYLKFLRDKFGSWPLALAAYNCGEKRVADAVSEQQTENYHTLSLPTESERYLYRLAAIKLILSDPIAYGYNIDRRECYDPLQLDYISLNLKGEVSLVDFALRLGITYHELKKLNPHLISKRLPAGRFNLALPTGYKDQVAGILRDLPRLATSKSYYLVKRGDTLRKISRRFNISVKHLIKLNRLESSKIMIGQKLRLR
jgi:hypothetical protein